MIRFAVLAAILAASVWASVFYTNRLALPCTTDTECMEMYGGDGSPKQ